MADLLSHSLTPIRECGPVRYAHDVTPINRRVNNRRTTTTNPLRAGGQNRAPTQVAGQRDAVTQWDECPVPVNSGMTSEGLQLAEVV